MSRQGLLFFVLKGLAVATVLVMFTQSLGINDPRFFQASSLLGAGLGFIVVSVLLLRRELKPRYLWLGVMIVVAVAAATVAVAYFLLEINAIEWLRQAGFREMLLVAATALLVGFLIGGDVDGIINPMRRQGKSQPATSSVNDLIPLSLGMAALLGALAATLNQGNSRLANTEVYFGSLLGFLIWSGWRVCKSKNPWWQLLFSTIIFGALMYTTASLMTYFEPALVNVGPREMSATLLFTLVVVWLMESFFQLRSEK